ncbi:HugZ family protein [Noviherbaspirillum denitrificans]|uniref:CREG-like beta-barrel domain-containing protein n=1 Tax=Noviherbaspirillum denitrificans TaxID=1968433 RepID=A0A254TA90_9BURK|nr:pyridoxamine 5'-phosphate oxidase family protein [Noviherbaspirillum denitrificans]OWW19485.1 hypothetical protein AYR66_08135 [Noviherbaspirillum denitrificans]
MKPDLSTAIGLLHRAALGALATQSVQLPGYPFATALPYVPDHEHCPVFLLSGLAEHTKNLLANPHASLLVTYTGQGSILESPRMTLVGDVERIDGSPAQQARYVRYQPDAAQYLELGDFAFFRLVPKRVRYIGGFAQMGWLEQEAWKEAPVLAPDEESAMLQNLGASGAGVLGIDCYGIDIDRDGRRERISFEEPISANGALAAAAALALNSRTP